MVVSLAALVALSWLGPRLSVGWLQGWMVPALLVLTLLSGSFLALAGRSRIVSLQYRRIDEAVETLTRPGASRDETLAAAVQLLDLAYITSGPTTTEAFATAEMRERLGDAFPLVLEVERTLLGEGGGPIYAVFTPLFTPGPPNGKPT